MKKYFDIDIADAGRSAIQDWKNKRDALVNALKGQDKSKVSLFGFSTAPESLADKIGRLHESVSMHR